MGDVRAFMAQVRARFKGVNTCCIPLSQGVTMALDHPQWAEFDVKAVMPYSYVQGDLRGVADGISTRFLNADKVGGCLPPRGVYIPSASFRRWRIRIPPLSYLRAETCPAPSRGSTGLTDVSTHPAGLHHPPVGNH